MNGQKKTAAEPGDTPALGDDVPEALSAENFRGRLDKLSAFVNFIEAGRASLEDNRAKRLLQDTRTAE